LPLVNRLASSVSSNKTQKFPSATAIFGRLHAQATNHNADKSAYPVHRSYCTEQPKQADQQIVLNGVSYMKDAWTNVSPSISSKIGRNLHLQPNHPLEIIKRKIIDHFHGSYRSRFGGCIFASVDNLSPVVSVEQNFDSLLVSPDHVSRSKIDNYYVKHDTVLRSHTSAHQRDLLRSGWNSFLVTGDVYRRDEIDKTHYPVFHQMEGVRVFDSFDLFSDMQDSSELSDFKIFEPSPTDRQPDKQEQYTVEATQFVEFQLKHTLISLVNNLFDDDVETRWVDTYFPFTHPSWELEVKINDEWVEMLGCGVMEQGILKKAGATDHIGWAFGLGLERFAMKLFGIPDIRLFWSDDVRFTSQFASGDSYKKFKPFSKYPPSYKDISFWIDNEFQGNDLFELARSVAGDSIEQMSLVDQFVHPKTQRTSHCYRITYRAMDRTMTDEEVNSLQNRIRQLVVDELNVELR